MRSFYLAAALVVLASPLTAGVDEAVNDHILPRLGSFAETTKNLNQRAQMDCTPDALRGPYNAAFDAWMSVGDVRLGPTQDKALSIAFWPDKKGFTPRKLTQLIETEDTIATDSDAFAEVSIAARGFFALERMLYDADFSGYETGSYSCTLVQAMTEDLASQATELETTWRDDFGATLLNPGAEGNTTYLDETEVVRALYTQVLSTLELTANTRLGRPLGEPTRPRPSRAEAWRSNRSLTNAVIATQSAYDLAKTLADWEMPETDAAMARVLAQAKTVHDPSFQSIDNLMKRLNVEILQQEIEGLESALEVEFGTHLGITPGFNSSDGD